MALYGLPDRGAAALRAAGVPKGQIDYQLGHVQQALLPCMKAANMMRRSHRRRCVLDGQTLKVQELSRKLAARTRKRGVNSH